MPLADTLELFGLALLALGLMSLGAPLVGVFLFARGAAFHGLVLPQLAAFGVALGYAVAPWTGHAHTHAVSAADGTHLAWAAAGVLGGLATLTLLARHGGSESARLAAAFVLASGGTTLAAARSPYGGLHLDALLSGEALAVAAPDAALVAAATVGAALLVAWRWRDLTSVAHDREFARLVGLPVLRLDLALGLATAAVVVVGTLALGPLAVFALLVLPPLGARAVARSMAAFLVTACAAGAAGAAAGAGLSFGLDLPLGASVVAGAGLVALTLALVARWARR